MERPKKCYNPCDDCQYSYSKQNQESGICKICEFKEYRDAEEQGLLLRLPVAEGTPVWTVMCGMTGKNPTLFRQDFEVAMLQYWGKAVFLTRTEAENAFAEIKEKK